MSIVEDTEKYEAWLGRQCDVVEDGLEEKHRLMASDAFRFLRATSYRFARKLPCWCPQFDEMPRVPSVGDAHVDNFGTWRDAEGRLVWGANDFDDAALLPYAYDLVRLAVSARLSPSFSLAPERRTAALLKGYVTGLSNPSPIFVDGDVSWMRALIGQPAVKRRHFAEKLARLQVARPPAAVAVALAEALPAGASVDRYASRQKGGGSLGRPRILALATWRGGAAVREAKALVPSAWSYASGKDDFGLSFMAIATSQFRSPDPFLRYGAGCIIRRIAADSEKIDLDVLDGEADQSAVLEHMGADIAAIHVGGRVEADHIAEDLRGRKKDWLDAAAEHVEAKVNADHGRWVKSRG